MIASHELLSVSAPRESFDRQRRQLLLLERNMRLLSCLLEEGAGENHRLSTELPNVSSIVQNDLSKAVGTYGDARKRLMVVLSTAMREGKFTTDIAGMLRQATSEGTLVRGDVDLESFNAKLEEILKCIRNGV